MFPRQPLLALVPALWLAACTETPTAPEPEPTPPDALSPRLLGGPSAISASGGAGTFNAGVVVTFSYLAIGFRNGSALGQLHFETESGGFPIEFRGRVTCLAVDKVNNRAWIGAVITSNGSTHPSFTTPIHQVGRDIWFRVVNYGIGPNQTRDRTTFVGFQGSAGIITSAEYCATRPWPGPPTDPVDARTNPLLSGDLFVL
jgi:hypothetical protein